MDTNEALWLIGATMTGGSVLILALIVLGSMRVSANADKHLDRMVFDWEQEEANRETPREYTD